MRIAIACPYGWDAPGGVQTHVRELAAHLRRRGHQTLVLAPATRRGDRDGVAIVGASVGVPFNGSVAPICPDPRTVRRIRAALAQFEPDVVHVHEPFAPSTGMFAALASRAPVVATFHAYVDRSILFAAASPLLSLVWRRLAVRLAVSRAAAEFVGRRFPGGVSVVPNGIDVERFRDASPADVPVGKRLLFVGRLDPRKGFRFAARAFLLLAARFPDVVLVVAGDGPERVVVDELPREVRERVVMVGAVSSAELPHYHAAADVYLAPNTGGESFGYVLVEAMAAGLPVVASDIPGYREVVRHGKEGLLVPPCDARALAEATTELLQHPELADRLAAGGRERVQRFRWDVVAAEIEEAYAAAAAR